MVFLLYLILGIAPSIIWLLFFLREDVHPEPKRMVIFIFLLGMLVTPIIGFFECLPMGFTEKGELKCLAKSIFLENFPLPWNLLLYFFLVVALIEEVSKYLVVRLKILKDPEFDEPIDSMLYMIIAALGFAAIENILNLFSLKELLIEKVSVIITFRFIGPTFLHALSSGTIGYFLARSFFEPKRKTRLLIFGFALAIALHGLFNFFIMMVDEKLMAEEMGFTLITLILIFLAVFIILSFQNLKRLASICKIQ